MATALQITPQLSRLIRPPSSREPPFFPPSDERDPLSERGGGADLPDDDEDGRSTERGGGAEVRSRLGVARSRSPDWTRAPPIRSITRRGTSLRGLSLADGRSVLRGLESSLGRAVRARHSDPRT